MCNPAGRHGAVLRAEQAWMVATMSACLLGMLRHARITTIISVKESQET